MNPSLVLAMTAALLTQDKVHPGIVPLPPEKKAPEPREVTEADKVRLAKAEAKRQRKALKRCVEESADIQLAIDGADARDRKREDARRKREWEEQKNKGLDVQG